MVHQSCRVESSPASASRSTSNSFLLQSVASELEAVRCLPAHNDGLQLPPACRTLLYSLPGNSLCADCRAPRPEWASTSYGLLLCVACCGRHRSYGVQISRVRSVDMDSWTHAQVLSVLEGGNEQFQNFMNRHQMGGSEMRCRRYKTKAALFYRTHLKKHVDKVAQAGVYQGREAARRRRGSQGAYSIASTRSSDSSVEAAVVSASQKQSAPMTANIQQQGITAT